MTDSWPKKAAPVILAFVCFLLVQPAAVARSKQVRRVLIINDLSTVASPGYAAMDEAINAVLQESPYQIELYSESLEATLFSDDASQREIRNGYIRKYEGRKPDVIIAVGEVSLRFMIEVHERAFPDIPIVFCGSTEEMLYEMKLDSHFTGAWGVGEPEKTLNLALRLQPNTRHVVVTGGVGTFDKVVEKIARESFRKYESKLDFTYLTDLDMPSLLDRLGHLPANTVVYHTSIMQDAAGNPFIDASQSIPMVAAAANAPVFAFDDVDVGNGAVGGNVLSWAAQAKAAGQMAVRVLNGEKPQDIPIRETANVNLIDWRALRRWGFRDGDLPPDSIVLYRETSVWESYKWYILGGLALIFAETLLIVEMLWLRVRRRRLEAALTKSEEKFSKAFLHSPLAKSITTVKDNRYIDVNETFLRNSGWLREEVIGRTPFDLGVWVHPDERLTLVNRIMSGQAVRNLEFQFRTKKGEIRDGLGSAELIEINGERCVLSAIADITDLKGAQRTLRESEERFRLVANTAPVMIWMSGIDKLCTYFNDPWLEFTGRSLEAEIGNGWAEGVHSEDLARCMDTYNQAFDQRQPFHMEYRLRRHDGECRWISDSGVPRFNADGSFAGYIGSAIDVTIHKAAEEALSKVSQRLIEAQEEERRWIARELHDDICQRLALVAFQAGSLTRSLDPSAVELSPKLRELNEQVLKLSKDVQGLSHHIHPETLEHLGLVSATSRFCRELSESQGVKVDFNCENFPEHVSKEISVCVFRVLQEGLQNAVKHSGGRDFHVSLRSVSNEIQLTVQDDGNGFDPKAVGNGSGLGLTSMKERLKLVNGVLTINSQPPHGTMIHASVPLNPQSTAVVTGQRT